MFQGIELPVILIKLNDGNYFSYMLVILAQWDTLSYYSFKSLQLNKDNSYVVIEEFYKLSFFNWDLFEIKLLSTLYFPRISYYKDSESLINSSILLMLVPIKFSFLSFMQLFNFIVFIFLHPNSSTCSKFGALLLIYSNSESVILVWLKFSILSEKHYASLIFCKFSHSNNSSCSKFCVYFVI
jgi:hypothetical protein